MGLFNIFKRILGKDRSAPNAAKEEPTPNVKTCDVNDNGTDIDSIYLTPLSNGLLPGEVLLTDWIDGKYTDSDIPGYFADKYGLDTETSVAKLQDEGFITEADLTESLQSFKVPELKAILRENDLKVSGKKQALIDRLMDHLSEEGLNTYIRHRPFKLTSEGQQVLEDDYYIVPAHKNGTKDGVYDVAGAVRYINQLDYQPSNSEISWALFKDALVTYSRKHEFGLYRHVCLHMAQQLQREENFEDALVYYLDIFIIDLSGLGRRDESEYALIVPGIKKNIETLSDKLKLDRESLHDLFGQAWQRTTASLPSHDLDHETSYQNLLATLDNDKD